MRLPVSSDTPDVIVIGGSSGSFATLRRLLNALPADFPAALLVAVHLDAGVSVTRVLGRSWAIQIGAAVDGAPLEHGKVYLAVADAHLMIHDHHLLVRRGPRENRARPSIDVLFRTAACSLGNRVIGVLLSGYLDDGVAGLAAIRRCGGITVAQDPNDAEVPDLPENAIRDGRVDHVTESENLPELLRALTAQVTRPAVPLPADIRLECAIAVQGVSSMNRADQLGKQSPFTCPDCDGALWEVHDEDVVRYRCHVGHAVTGNVMLGSKTSAMEDLMWRTLRMHEERAALCRRLALDAKLKGQLSSSEVFTRRAAGCEEDAAMTRQLIDRIAPKMPAPQAAEVAPG